jgi:hypothetical protein
VALWILALPLVYDRAPLAEFKPDHKGEIREGVPEVGHFAFGVYRLPLAPRAEVPHQRGVIAVRCVRDFLPALRAIFARPEGHDPHYRLDALDG